MTDSSVGDSDPARLADLLKMSDNDGLDWRPEDFGPILRHQLAVPIQFDLAGLDRQTARKLRVAASSQGLLLKSFNDLLHHASPPIELIKLTKDFAKANRNHPDSLLPPEVASVLYYASIAVALVRCRRRITGLDDEALREGFAWAGERAWVDEATRSLFQIGLQHILERKGSRP